VSESYQVRLDSEDLCFSAAHFITFKGDVCEPLHGHNYRVAAEIEGPLDENQYVIDFVQLRDALRKTLDQLDHRMLLPTEHPLIKVACNDREVEVRFEDRRWVFPRADCLLLPMASTTAELLARHIGQQLLAELKQCAGARPRRLRVAVEESFGQWGVCELRDD
jgi:6-pyruvoyltetrahydropterin/6-carboxytetrahydropterin synthase